MSRRDAPCMSDDDLDAYLEANGFSVVMRVPSNPVQLTVEHAEAFAGGDTNRFLYDMHSRYAARQPAGEPAHDAA